MSWNYEKSRERIRRHGNEKEEVGFYRYAPNARLTPICGRR